MIKKLFETAGIALIAGTMLGGAMLVTLSACEQKGPAETAGGKRDNAVEKAREHMEDAGDSIRDAAKPSNNHAIVIHPATMLL